jgi:hypothetical protein
MSVYPEINGQRWLVDDWRRTQAAQLQELCGALGRPVSPSELASALCVDLDDVTPMALVRNGHALLRRIPETGAKGLWPRASNVPRLIEALKNFRRVEVGEEFDWKEPRRTRTRAYRRRKMTVSSTLRSRVQTSLRRARNHLGLSSLKRVEQHHLALIPDAVWTVEMESSAVPRELWNTNTQAAKRARKSANNRRSEINQFLSWAEWKGYLTLDTAEGGTLPEAWTEFVKRAEASREYGIDVAARRIARIAYTRLQADSPARLVEIGFDRLAEEIRSDKRYASERSARTTLSKLRKAWNACATARGRDPFPRWESGPRGLEVPRREDGGLQNSWWSAKAFIVGKPTILDRPEMEIQRRQAKDVRDWWTLSDPTLRPTSEGGPLPPRPERTRQGMGRKRFGARSEDEITALKPLAIISELQRFAMTLEPEEAYRIAPECMLAMRWEDLLSDRSRVRRFIRHVFEQNRRTNEGRYITAGVRKVWYIHTIMWAYLPAWLKLEIRHIRDERAGLDVGTNDGLRRSQQLENQRAAVELKIEAWEEESREIKRFIEDLIEEHGGIVMRKDRTEIREHLSHREIRRMAAAFRERRLDLEEALRNATRRLCRRRERLRAEACIVEEDGEPCGRSNCDVHHPFPRLSPRGIAFEVMSRAYCVLITREAMLRLHSILPWRPGTLRRAVLGVHIDPKTLEITIKGRDDKIARDGRGRIKRQRVAIPELEWWDDPEEVEATVKVLRVLIDEARVWLWENPTKTGARLRVPGDERRLLLNSYGVPWRVSGTYTSAFQDALSAGAKLVNDQLQDGEEAIELPTGYGTTGSYVMRFLYGHRIREHGGTYEDIAAALGNSPATARRHYQDEQEGETINRIAATLRGRQPAQADPTSVEGREASDCPSTEFEALVVAKAAFDAEADRLALSEVERSEYWAQRKEVIKGIWRAGSAGGEITCEPRVSRLASPGRGS